MALILFAPFGLVARETFSKSALADYIKLTFELIYDLGIKFRRSNTFQRMRMKIESYF